MVTTAPPSAPPPPLHEDTPPPHYSEVVPCPSDPAPRPERSPSCRTPVLVAGLVTSLGLVLVLACVVGDLWVRLDTLQVRKLISLSFKLFVRSTTTTIQDKMIHDT